MFSRGVIFFVILCAVSLYRNNMNEEKDNIDMSHTHEDETKSSAWMSWLFLVMAVVVLCAGVWIALEEASALYREAHAETVPVEKGEEVKTVDNNVEGNGEDAKFADEKFDERKITADSKSDENALATDSVASAPAHQEADHIESPTPHLEVAPASEVAPISEPEAERDE